MIRLPSVTFVIVENRWPERVEKFCRYIRSNVQDAKITVKADLPKASDKTAYDRFCSLHLHECFSTDHAMVCQLDGFPVRWDQWDDAFLNFDYVGAPWPPGWLRAGGIESDSRVGNGGCSLRSRRLCAALREAEWTPQPDDVFISATCRPWLEKRGLLFADPLTAARFGREYETPEHALIGPSFSFHDIRIHPHFAIF